MSNLFNKDFTDFLLALNEQDVEYLLIGGYTVILYGNPRTTGDLDIWLKNSTENRIKVIKACFAFGLPTDNLSFEKFNNPEVEVFSYGRPPVCIELLIRIKGIEFEDAYKNSVVMHPDGFPVRVVGYHDLVRLKKLAGRPKDLDDLKRIVDPTT